MPKLRCWKVLVRDSVKLVNLSIEKVRVKNEALYPYFEKLNRSFTIRARENWFVNEHVFVNDATRTLTLCLVKNSQFSSIALKYLIFFPSKARITAC